MSDPTGPTGEFEIAPARVSELARSIPLVSDALLLELVNCLQVATDLTRLPRHSGFFKAFVARTVGREAQSLLNRNVVDAQRLLLQRIEELTGQGSVSNLALAQAGRLLARTRQDLDRLTTDESDHRTALDATLTRLQAGWADQHRLLTGRLEAMHHLDMLITAWSAEQTYRGLPWALQVVLLAQEAYRGPVGQYEFQSGDPMFRDLLANKILAGSRTRLPRLLLLDDELLAPCLRLESPADIPMLADLVRSYSRLVDGHVPLLPLPYVVGRCLVLAAEAAGPVQDVVHRAIEDAARYDIRPGRTVNPRAFVRQVVASTAAVVAADRRMLSPAEPAMGPGPGVEAEPVVGSARGAEASADADAGPVVGSARGAEASAEAEAECASEPSRGPGSSGERAPAAESPQPPATPVPDTGPTRPISAPVPTTSTSPTPTAPGRHRGAEPRSTDIVAVPRPLSAGSAASVWGLVLAGGGAKGAYQVGVLRRLAEEGLEPRAISGASIGALNAAVVASSPSLAEGAARLAVVWEALGTAYQAAENERGAGVGAGVRAELAHVPVPENASGPPAGLRELHRRRHSPILRTEFLRGLLERWVDPAALGRGPDLWVSVFPAMAGWSGLGWLVDLGRSAAGASATWLRVQDLAEHDMHDALLASAALPFVFPPRRVAGRPYRDGGLGDNVPLNPLAADSGCTNAVVVHLGNGVVWDGAAYPGCAPLEIRPTDDIVEHPDRRLGNLGALLDFRPARLSELQRRGYRDAAALVGATRAMLDRAHTLRGSLKEVDSALAAARNASEAESDRPPTP
ncbi:patatin-like phospholipase family protein [Embleya sp. NPDC050154]|uniref:patatin-like phospholipase family protein n=1 Tax=Embleya sp. NPDC050154 TaxID=3363988 RepID=UPI0037A37B26